MRYVSILALGAGLAIGPALWAQTSSNAQQTGQAGQAGGQAGGQTGAQGTAGGQTGGGTESGIPSGDAAGRGLPGQANGAAAGGQIPWQVGAWNEQPWFADPRVRVQLRLDDQLFGQLQENYAQSWQRYQQELAGLQGNLADEGLIARRQQLTQAFQSDFNTAVDQIFTDPLQRQRFSQLYLQYQGFNAFNDPTVQQQLNLNERQLEQLRRLQQEWDEQMQLMSENFGRDRNLNVRFNRLRLEAGQRITNVLTDDQRRLWLQMVGPAFNFPPEVYFPAQAGNVQGNANQRSVPNQTNPAADPANPPQR